MRKKCFEVLKKKKRRHLTNEMARKQETVSKLTFLKWPFASDFTIKCEDGKVTEAVCKYCSNIDFNVFIKEAKSRNIRGMALKSLESFRRPVTYIHQPSFSRHVGEIKSLHNWCKKQLNAGTGNHALPQPERGERRVDENILNNSKNK